MKILVTIPVEEKHRRQLKAAAPEEEFVFSSLSALTQEEVAQYEVIIGNVPPKLIAGSKKLRWMQLNSAGTDGYIKPGVLAPGTLLTNATGAYGLAISEHMTAALLMLMKKLDRYYENQKQCLWKDEGQVTSIFGTEVLVVGAGDIGGEFAKRMNALGANVTGIRRHKVSPPPYLKYSGTLQELDQLLPKMDIIASCLPGTKETYHLFDEKRFSLMKKGAFFLNVGRGTAVDSIALTAALNSGQLGGAFLDVTEPEPLPEDDPLWKVKNLLITPHISGGYHLPATLDKIVSIAAENLISFQKGENLRNIVDFSTGYREFTETAAVK